MVEAVFIIKMTNKNDLFYVTFNLAHCVWVLSMSVLNRHYLYIILEFEDSENRYDRTNLQPPVEHIVKQKQNQGFESVLWDLGLKIMIFFPFQSGLYAVWQRMPWSACIIQFAFGAGRWNKRCACGDAYSMRWVCCQ